MAAVEERLANSTTGSALACVADIVVTRPPFHFRRQKSERISQPELAEL
jgi:hypothetical protein